MLRKRPQIDQRSREFCSACRRQVSLLTSTRTAPLAYQVEFNASMSTSFPTASTSIRLVASYYELQSSTNSVGTSLSVLALLPFAIPTLLRLSINDGMIVRTRVMTFISCFSFVLSFIIHIYMYMARPYLLLQILSDIRHRSNIDLTTLKNKIDKGQYHHGSELCGRSALTLLMHVNRIVGTYNKDVPIKRCWCQAHPADREEIHDEYTWSLRQWS